jgi:hypothetical protein
MLSLLVIQMSQVVFVHVQAHDHLAGMESMHRLFDLDQHVYQCFPCPFAIDARVMIALRWVNFDGGAQPLQPWEIEESQIAVGDPI